MDTPKKLRAWLADKHPSWSAAIALRIALRLWPIALDPARWRKGSADPVLTASWWRALVICLAARNIASGDKYAAGFDAVHAADIAAARAARADLLATRRRTDDAFRAADSTFLAARAFSAAAADDATRAADAAAGAAARAALAAADAAFFAADVAALAAGWVAGAPGAQRLLALPLWPTGTPQDIADSWGRARADLLAADPGNQLWIEWYERRLRGEAQGFALSPDADMAMDRKLVAAGNAWWDRDPRLVTADIAAWLDELSPPTASDETNDFLPDPQTGDAPSFTSNAAGQIAIEPHAHADELLTDTRAAERHTAARARATAAAEALRGHNQADYLASYAGDLFEALGADIGSGNLAETVLLANRLRQGAAAHAAAGPQDVLQPLPPGIVRPLDDLIEAANLHIGMQPVLAAMDLAALGPDAAVTAAPADIAVVLGDEGATQAIEARTRDYIDVAAGMSPAEPDPGNRQSRRFGALMANFGRQVVVWANDYRLEIGAFGTGFGGGAVAIGAGLAAAATASLGVGLVTGAGTLAYGGWKLLCNMKKHPKEWMNLAGPSPTSKANMRRLLAWLDDHLPAESGQSPPDKGE